MEESVNPHQQEEETGPDTKNVRRREKEGLLPGICSELSIQMKDEEEIFPSVLVLFLLPSLASSSRLYKKISSGGKENEFQISIPFTLSFSQWV